MSRYAERGHIYVGQIGKSSRDVLLVVTSVQGDKIKLLGHLGYGTVDIDATWANGEPPASFLGPIGADDYLDAASGMDDAATKA